jgi:Cu+-exporting ATPase
MDMTPAAAGSLPIDPVCGMSVDPATAKHVYDYRDTRYYFCAASCRTKFMAQPGKYLEPGSVAPEPVIPGAIYTCPMDPEIQQVGPGVCPICGMALEPMDITAESGPNPELADMTRRLWIGLVLALPVIVLEMGDHIFDLHRLLGHRGSAIIQLILATPVVWWAGWPFLQRGWQSLVTRKFNMFTLVAMGTLVAWTYSVVATLLPEAVAVAAPAGMSGVPVYFEAAAVITVLVLLGQVLELKARDRTSDAIRSLLKLAPETAQRVNADGSISETALKDVMAGDVLRVRPGDKIPVDGVISQGQGTLDEALMTGESMPVGKGVGAKVIAGAINVDGSFEMRAEKIGNETMLARIVQMVATAQRSRAPIQRLVDRVSGWFVPLVVSVAVIAFLAWYLFGPEPKLTYALLAAVAVLIIACPCALGLATPMSIMVGVGRGARAGVLVRDAAALERLEQVNTLVIDKTGTLTEGKPSVQQIITVDGQDENEMLRLAAGVERGSSHPLAQAIAAAAEARQLPVGRVMGFDQTTGKGVFGMVERKRVMVGTAAFFSGVNIATAELESAADELRRAGATVVFVAINGKLAGAMSIADAIKPSTAAALAELKALGLTLVMLTGDNRLTADVVARQLGLTQVEAEVLPEMKAEVIERLKKSGRVVAMAGDGVNDGPALATADVGIAMGTGTDVAMESAGITLVKGDLLGLVRAYRLSRAIMQNIRQNLTFAFIYNAAGVPVAAGLLYPTFGIVLSPIIAAAAMSLSSVSVISNALRLRRLTLD